MRLYRCKKTFTAHVNKGGVIDEPVDIVVNAIHAFEDDVYRKLNEEIWEPLDIIVKPKKKTRKKQP